MPVSDTFPIFTPKCLDMLLFRTVRSTSACASLRNGPTAITISKPSCTRARTVRRPRNTAGCDGRYFVHFVGTGNGRRSRTQYLRPGLPGIPRSLSDRRRANAPTQDDPDGAGSRRRFGRRRSYDQRAGRTVRRSADGEQMIRLAARWEATFRLYRRPADARYRPGRNPRSRSGFADRTQAGHRQTGRIGQYGRSLRRRRARTARKPARRFVRAAAPAMERTHRQRLRDIRFPHSSDDRGDQRRTLSGRGSLCFHVRFGICRLRNFRRADAGSAGIRRNVCISGRYDLSECEKRDKFSIWEKIRKLATPKHTNWFILKETLQY